MIKTLLAKSLSRSAILTTAPVVIALVLSASISFAYNWKLKSYRDASDHTFKTISGIDAVLMRLQDAETGQRGFVITGASDYLAPFQAGRRDLDVAISSLNALMADNPSQMARLARLEVLAKEKIAELSETIEIRETLGFEAAKERVAVNTGKLAMDEIRLVASEVRTAEEILLRERTGNARFAERMMIVVAVICVMLSLLGRLLAYLLRPPSGELGGAREE